MQYLGTISKPTEWSHFQGKTFNITINKVYVPTTSVTNAKEAEVEWFNEDLQDLLELTPQKDVLSSQGAGEQK